MDRCHRCPGVHKCLPPDGPLNKGGLLFIGEAPGKEEERRERIFIGKTGRELDDHYLPLAGFRRASSRLTNAIKCLPASAGGKLDMGRPADRALLQSCADAHLYPEIVEQEPALLVPLGAFACRAIDPRIDLELHHGRPFLTHWRLMAFPMYHPALGMHSPKRMLEIRTDWIRLKEYQRGTLHLPTDDYSEPDYAEVTDATEFEELDAARPLAADTETSRSLGPFCLTYSQRPGMGRLIRASRADLLARFQQKLDGWTAPILFHNWLYDASVTGEMGLRFPQHLMVDTMLLAFHLGNLPQGLKVLAHRELGMTMQDFDDLVRPYSTRRVLDYYQLAQMTDWPKPEPRMERDSKTGDWELYKPQGMGTKLKRFFTDFKANPDKDVFQMWDKNWVEEQPMIEAQCGLWPGLDIAHVPFEKLLHYACRDPDATLRLYSVLTTMRSRVNSYPQEQWRVA